MAIKLTERNNHRYILEQCYQLAMSDDNCHSVSDMIYLARFLVDYFGDPYFHFDYIKNDHTDIKSLTVLVRLSLGESVADMKVCPNHMSLIIDWNCGEELLFCAALDFMNRNSDHEEKLVYYINKIWKKEIEKNPI